MAFRSTNPLWIGDGIRGGPGELPAGWSSFSFWQRGESPEASGLGVDVWNGNIAELLRCVAGCFLRV
jgi:hypothetical protein